MTTAEGGFGGVVYEDTRWRTVTTSLPCGAEIVATPEGCGIDPATLGYPDAWALTKDHDPAHLWLAMALGLTSSPTLERQAHARTYRSVSGTEIGPAMASDELVAYEEAAVHAVLAYRNAAIREGWTP